MRWMCFAGMVLLLSGKAYAQGKQKIADLKGQWKFSIGNDERWSAEKYNDSGWETIYAPSPWENQGFWGYNGYAFYRKQVHIPSRFKGHMFTLELGYIDDVDLTYFNGVPIGSSGAFPPGNKSAYNARREYSIPENLIKYEQMNTIAIKVYDSKAEGGHCERKPGHLCKRGAIGPGHQPSGQMEVHHRR
jgi:hypothetical protein